MDFEYLHIRLTKEQKDRYKNLCEAKGLSQVECFLKMLDAAEFFSGTTTKHVGRPKMKYPENWEELYAQWDNKDITSKDFIEKANLKRATFYNLLSDYKKIKQKEI